LERMALFPGCLILQRMPQYEKATKEVLGAIGIQVESIPRAACCGAPLESFTDRWLHFAAYNLSLAEKMGLNIVTLCGNCANTLLRANTALDNLALRREVNGALSKMELRYDGNTTVKHLVQLLVERLDVLSARMTRRLSLRVAVTHPCQAFRPHELTCFDDPLEPQAMRQIVALTGAEIVDYLAEHDCCGSTLYLADQGLGLEAGRRKLASAAGADVLVDACGNCQLLLERFRGFMGDSQERSRLVVLTLPQLLGLAMGIDASDLGIPAASGRVIAKAAP
jgi:succinate dehydrogenase / fumarate reductase cytochrome b subunit